MSSRILVVDDNPLNRKLVEALLPPPAWELRTAFDAEEAFRVLGGFRPDLILMDVRMPGMSGLDLTRRLKTDPATRDIPIVALTARVLRQDEQNAREAGCDGFMAKPIDTRTFAGELARRLGVAAASAEAAVVLVVEDNSITRKVVRAALVDAGYSVVEAEDGRAALAAAERQRPDLVLLDMVLPDAHGLDVIGRLRVLPGCADVPVLAFSGAFAAVHGLGAAVEGPGGVGSSRPGARAGHVKKATLSSWRTTPSPSGSPGWSPGGGCVVFLSGNTIGGRHDVRDQAGHFRPPRRDRSRGPCRARAGDHP